MLTGALIIESLRVGAVLDDPGLVVQRLTRVEPTDVTPAQPGVWTLLEFRSDNADPGQLAESLSRVLDAPGWYASFHSDGQVFVVFPARVFQYPREADAQHEEVLAYAASVGIPNEQCAWR